MRVPLARLVVSLGLFGGLRIGHERSEQLRELHRQDEFRRRAGAQRFERIEVLQAHGLGVNSLGCPKDRLQGQGGRGALKGWSMGFGSYPFERIIKYPLFLNTQYRKTPTFFEDLSLGAYCPLI